MYKKGQQDDQAKLRAICLLSHTRKVIDTAILTMIHEAFTTAKSQFGFQAGIAVKQALREADENARQGFVHEAVLDLEKAYNRVNRETLIELMKELIQEEVRGMARAMLGPMQIPTTGDPKKSRDLLTRGLPQGAPSSPVFV